MHEAIHKELDVHMCSQRSGFHIANQHVATASHTHTVELYSVRHGNCLDACNNLCLRFVIIVWEGMELPCLSAVAVLRSKS